VAQKDVDHVRHHQFFASLEIPVNHDLWKIAVADSRRRSGSALRCAIE
jgi:hypothetical protein